MSEDLELTEAKVQKGAPNFSAKAVMEDGSFKDISLSDYKGKYVVLFFYPLDFTFVCPTEIVAFSDRIQDFKDRGAEVLGVSIDSHFSHLAWRNTPRAEGGIGEVQYPLIADLTKTISWDYGVLLEDAGISLRGLFIIDKEGVVRHITVNDLPLGRNVDEVLRVLDALQYTEEHGEVCPANWSKGKEAMTPTQEGLADYSKKNL